MTRLAATLALMALTASTAFAQQLPDWQMQTAVFGPRNVVICDGQIVGRDPDPAVRSQLYRDCGHLYGGD